MPRMSLTKFSFVLASLISSLMGSALSAESYYKYEYEGPAADRILVQLRSLNLSSEILPCLGSGFGFHCRIKTLYCRDNDSQIIVQLLDVSFRKLKKDQELCAHLERSGAKVKEFSDGRKYRIVYWSDDTDYVVVGHVIARVPGSIPSYYIEGEIER